MPRRRSTSSAIAKMLRDMKKAEKARQRQSEQRAREAEKAQKAYLRELEEARKLEEKSRRLAQLEEEQAMKLEESDRKRVAREMEQAKKLADKELKLAEKERHRLYVESRIAQTELQNAELEAFIDELNGVLATTFDVDDYLDLDSLKTNPAISDFQIPLHLRLKASEPRIENYLPEPPSTLQKAIPWVKSKFEREVHTATKLFKGDMDKYQAAENSRKAGLQALQEEHDRKTKALLEEAESRNNELEQLKQDFAAGQPDAIVDYFVLVLSASNYPEGFPQHAKLAYVPESKQIVIEYDLPPFEIVPEIGTYKYVKSSDEITTTARPISQRRALYASVIAQVTLRTVHEVLEADRTEHIDSVVFNGYVDTIDKATGRPARICLVTLRVTRDTFLELDLENVDPELCLKALSASVSKSPSELAPVRPVLEFDMVDPRFIEETDVISTLDQRPNLMKLSPSEFEALISNLFQEMGLETRLTQASRDGGVDCVAYDPRPILGGKVVIQAKRYKNTVGVSAVRDLYGTLQNEGASKGILVTTSGYGKAAFEFAEGKPIELLSGSNLLYLLSEHAGIEAKIEVPDDWKDPVQDS